VRRVAVLVLAITAGGASAAGAQSWDVSTMAGYALPVELDHAARGVEAASIGPGSSWQFAVGRNFGLRWGAEVLWTEQFTSYRVESNGVTGEMFKMSIMQLHGDLLYSFGAADARLRPFVLAGLGSTFFNATDLQSETKFSMGLGGGVKWFVRDEIAFRGQFRYKATFLNDAESTDFCDPFGFCQSTLRQFEFAGGVTFRF
jgi:opacity protein-like surface antigen